MQVVWRDDLTSAERQILSSKQPDRFARSQYIVLVALILAVHLGLLAYSARVHSPAIDEVAHLPAGLRHWMTGEFELYPVNPPLVRMVAAVPVLFMNPATDWSRVQSNAALRSEFAVAKDFSKINGQRTMPLFNVGRIACFIFGLTGGLVCLIWSRNLFGNSSGIVALLLWCFAPAVLAHGSMLTPDVAAAALGLLSIYRYRAWLHKATWKNTGWLGLSVGLALSTKFTWLIVFPLTVMMTLPAWRMSYWSSFRPVLEDLLKICTAAVLSILVINAIYCFEESGTPLDEFEFVSETFIEVAKGDFRGITNRFRGTHLGNLPIPLPRRYVEGIDIQKRDFEIGQPSYLAGEWKQGGWWYYYALGMLVKTPLPTLILFALSILCACLFWRWKWPGVGEASLLVIPPLITMCLVSSQTGLNHHVRYVLPMLPFLHIIGSRIASFGKLGKGLTYILLSWQVASVFWFAPHWLSFFNEASGGPRRGHDWLVNSNIDWGQDIYLLKEWQRGNAKERPLHAVLFTMSDPRDLGLEFKLPPPYVPDHPEIRSADGLRGPQAGLYAVSVSILRGMQTVVPDGEGNWQWSGRLYQYFDQFTPTGRIGYSVYLYEICQDDIEKHQFNE